MKNLKLVIAQPEGWKRGCPLVECGAKLVNPETGEEVPGIGNVTLLVPGKGGVLRCTAEINLSSVEIAALAPETVAEKSVQ